MTTSPSNMTNSVVSDSSSCDYLSYCDESTVLDLQKHKMHNEELSRPVYPPHLSSSIAKRDHAAIQDPNTRPSNEHVPFRDEMQIKLQDVNECQRKRPLSPTGMKSTKKRSPKIMDFDLEQLKKKNEALKRYRYLKRLKENKLAIHAVFLERENLKLKMQLLAVVKQNVELKTMMYHRIITRHLMFSQSPVPFLPIYL